MRKQMAKESLTKLAVKTMKRVQGTLVQKQLSPWPGKELRIAKKLGNEKTRQ
jgi:hypothetical protein